MFYEIPENINARLEELENIPMGIDFGMKYIEKQVLIIVSDLISKGYVPVFKCDVNRNGVDTKIEINGKDVATVTGICDIFDIMKAVQTVVDMKVA